LLYKPTYPPESPEFKLISQYLALSSGGVLSNPTFSDTIDFAGPEGSYEDVQVIYAVDQNLPSLPKFQPPPQWSPDVPQVTQRVLQYEVGIDLVVRFPNIVLNDIGSLLSPYQWIAPLALDRFAPMLQRLTIVAHPEATTDGNLWLGAKETNIGRADAVGDYRYSAATDTAAAGATCEFNGIVWEKIVFQSIFSSGVRQFWKAVSLAPGK
jgi:hypothetical protein